MKRVFNMNCKDKDKELTIKMTVFTFTIKNDIDKAATTGSDKNFIISIDEENERIYAYTRDMEIEYTSSIEDTYMFIVTHYGIYEYHEDGFETIVHILKLFYQEQGIAYRDEELDVFDEVNNDYCIWKCNKNKNKNNV
jgi:hypothetical protein